MGLLNEINNKNLIEESKQNIRKVYLHDERPWVIGYSGGKDSSTVLQLVIEELISMRDEGIELNKTVYVISSDTMVETPLIISRIGESLNQIREFANKENLPIETKLVRPASDNTFWVNLIGKGYPVPNQSFRWCTDRMKIEPSNKFIKEKVSDHGEVIVLLGVRESESISRGNSIRSHEIEGKLIMKHSSLTNAFTFAPIKAFDVDDVWEYLLSNECPWGADNRELYKLYADSNSNECPLIIDKETKERVGSCGNSRFGCWVCTVVNEDKALTGFIESGEEWLRPLLVYRNWLRDHRDDRNMRMKVRSNGSVYLVSLQEKHVDSQHIIVIPKKGGRERVEIVIDEDTLTSSDNQPYTLIKEEKLNEYINQNNIDLTSYDDHNLIIKTEEGYSMLGNGPYTFEARAEMLERLLKIQKEYCERNITLITEEELRQIRREWAKRGLIKDVLPLIYKKVYKEDLKWEENDVQFIDEIQYKVLDELCEEKGVYVNGLIEMLQLEQNRQGRRTKKKTLEGINKALTKDYLHY